LLPDQMMLFGAMPLYGGIPGTLERAFRLTAGLAAAGVQDGHR